MLDKYGYDYAMRLFKGYYENADRDVTNNSGDQTTLRMGWDSLFNPTQPEFSGEGAWVTNSQNGLYVGQNQKTYRWHYFVKFQYTGPGSPLWGNFTIVQEQYLDAGKSVPPRHKPPLIPVPKW